MYYYHPDHLGSTGFVTDAKGKLYEHIEYFPFGETWGQEHSNTLRTPYLFTGKGYDQETGLYYFGARYYDPRASVWQSPDAILDDYLLGKHGYGVYTSHNLGLYTYSYNSPLVYKDPDGNCPICITILGGAAIGAAGYMLRQALAGEEITMSGVGEAALVGAAFGAGAVLAPGVALAAGIGLTAEGAADVADRASDWGNLSAHEKRAVIVDGVMTALSVTGMRGGARSGNRRAHEEEPAGVNCSFASGTLVMTKGGLKPIESIKESDIVLARDEATGEESWKPVLGTFNRWHDDALNLTLADGTSGKTETIVVTSEHPFYLKDNGWTAAGVLTAGNQVRSAAGHWLKVAAVAKLPQKLIAYNLAVQDFHTYFVGSSEVWVHNCGTTNGEPKLLADHSSKASLSQSRLEHIVERHWHSSGAKGAGKFSADVGLKDLRGMINETVAKGSWRPNTNGRPGKIAEYEFNSPIGTNMAGKTTSRMRVVVGDDGGVVTAFPY